MPNNITTGDFVSTAHVDMPRKLCKYTSEALQMNIWQFFADRLFEFFAVLLLGSLIHHGKLQGTNWR